MSDEEKKQNTAGAAQSANERDDASAHQDGERVSAEEMRRELNAALGELRSELAQLKMEEARDRAKSWIQENPTLAIFLAAGAGILTGRLVSKAFEPAPPPSLSERAQRYATGVGRDVAGRIERARREALRRAEDAGEEVSRQARDFATRVAERALAMRDQAAEQALRFGEDIDREAQEVSKSVAKQAEEASERVKASARDLSKRVDRDREGFDVAGAALNVAKTAVAALFVKKASDWIRKTI